MGTGSEVSVVSADFVLLNSNLESLLALLHISRRVFNRELFSFYLFRNWSFLKRFDFSFHYRHKTQLRMGDSVQPDRFA